MKVGNIVNCDEEISETQFNCLTMDEFLACGVINDKRMELPTLIVGWETVKSNFGDVSILSKIVVPPTKDGYGGVYWTFSKAEKRGIYETNLKEFKEKCYIDLVKNIKTYNIDPIIYKINTTEELSDRIMKLTGAVGYLFQERIVYIYKGDNIYVIDLELIDFIGFDKNLVINTLKDHLSMFGDDFEENYTEELKHLDIKYTPYLEYKNAI